MKVTAGHADAFCAQPESAIRAILLYGPDEGLVRERGRALVAGVVDDPADPFRVADLAPGEVVKDPARLADEAAAIAMTGGRRVVQVRAATAALAPALANAVERLAEAAPEPADAALIVVESGDLSPRDTLRKLAESDAAMAAVPCYADEGRGLARVIADSLAQEGITASPDARAFLETHLGSDRAVTRQEIAKLALYVGADATASRTVSLADVAAVIGDATTLSMDDAGLALTAGDAVALDRALMRLWHDGAAPISVLRASGRHLDRVHKVRIAVDRGMDTEQALSGLRPPVFFRHRDTLRRHLSWWPANAFPGAMARLLETERLTKRAGSDQALLAGRALLSLCVQARRRARRDA
jgi:DNA polymerase-3 subunit delta